MHPSCHRHSQFSLSNHNNRNYMLTFSSASGCVSFLRRQCSAWIKWSRLNVTMRGESMQGESVNSYCIWCFFYIYIYNCAPECSNTGVLCFCFGSYIPGCIALNWRGLILVHKSCTGCLWRRFLGNVTKLLCPWYAIFLHRDRTN